MMRSLDPKPRKAYLDKMMNIHSQKEKKEQRMERVRGRKDGKIVANLKEYGQEVEEQGRQPPKMWKDEDAGTKNMVIKGQLFGYRKEGERESQPHKKPRKIGNNEIEIYLFIETIFTRASGVSNI